MKFDKKVKADTKQAGVEICHKCSKEFRPSGLVEQHISYDYDKVLVWICSEECHTIYFYSYL